MTAQVFHGDCLAILPTLAADSIDACVTDPPYHLTSIVKRFGGNGAAPAQFGTDCAFSRASRGFMGKQWDGGDVAFRVETWAAIYRVLKPGAHLVAFGGSRTFHRMVCAIEDAGFEIRDTLQWIYGTGFPKSHDVSKGIDKAAGATREVIGAGQYAGRGRRTDNAVYGESTLSDGEVITAPATPEAAQWAGWGTALKPAFEPILLARKPLIGTVVQNVLAHGTGAINIDACRIEGVKDVPASPSGTRGSGYGMAGCRAGSSGFDPNTGRWPANVLHDGSPEVLEAFAAYGERGAAAPASGASLRDGHSSVARGRFAGLPADREPAFHADTGTAARFFYSAKASKADRAGSKHPTVKPLDLMRWLTRLVTPPGGRILDPFAGSGTTLQAGHEQGFDVTGIEREEEYITDIHNRLARNIQPAPAKSDNLDLFAAE